MNPLHWILLTTLVAMASPTPVRAQFFSLPELVGPAPTYGDSPIEFDFDLGQEFGEVDDVLLMLEATVTSLTYESCGTINDPEPCELRVVHPGFHIQLEGPDRSRTYAVVDDFRSFPKMRAGVFQRSFIEFSFDHLRDGMGTLSFGWSQLQFIPEQIIRNFTPPTGSITDAVLIVNGTPLPGRVAVCHKGKHSMSASAKAAPAHLEHGDTLGACP